MAYATALSAWLVSSAVVAGVGVLMWVLAILFDWPVALGWWELLIIGVVFGLLIYPMTIAVVTYFAPRKKELVYVDTGHARAVMVVQPDPRHGQLDKDHLASAFAAWPKKRGAGAELGKWLTERTHSQGGRVTDTATPWMAARYLKGGYVNDGRNLGDPDAGCKPTPYR